MQQRTFTGAQGQTLAAEAVGEGPPVLLAHGGGQTRAAWSKVSRALAKAGYQAIAIDMRGHGESEWSPSGAYHFSDFAADLVAISDTLQGKPAVVGASLGGLAGLLAEGELRPGIFTSLTLVDVTPQLEPEGVAHILGFMAAHIDEGFATTDEAAAAIGAYLPHRKQRGPSETLERYLRKCDDGRLRWHWDPQFIAVASQSSPEDSEARFAAAARQLNLPVHLIRGASSNLVTTEAAQQFLQFAPHATYTDIAGAGHMVVGDRNDAFTDAIVRFLHQQAPLSHAHS
jgi:Predicted hydrolases or acyltransferases (alpha/beta hydrolase superfamily)